MRSKRCAVQNQGITLSYPVVGDLSSEQRYPTIKQPEPEP